MPKFRKKPVIIEAHQLPPIDVDPSDELVEYLSQIPGGSSERDGCFAIETLEGVMIASPGDWVIKGVQGEFYPCKPDIFVSTYEEVDDA